MAGSEPLGRSCLRLPGAMLKPRLRHGHDELAVVELVNRRVAVAFDRLALDLPITSQLHYVPVGSLWCYLMPVCTVATRRACWAVTARDCQDRDVRIHHGRTSQHQSVVVAQSWLKGLPQAAVDRHKGGELASLAGDTLQEAIEAASRVSVGFAARRICLGVLRRELVPGWEPTRHLSEPRCPPSVQAKPGESDGPLDHRSPTWTCQLQGLLPGGSAPTGVKMPAPGPTMTKPQRAAPTHRRDQQQHGNAAPLPCCAPSHVRCTPSKLPRAYRPRAAAHSPRSANSKTPTTSRRLAPVNGPLRWSSNYLVVHHVAGRGQ